MQRIPIVIVTGLLAAASLSGQNKRVLYVARLGPAVYERMRTAVPNVTLIQGDPARLAEQLADVDGVIGSVSPALIGRAPKLKWIQSESAGVENYIFLPGFA